jgi:hypothetical protein
MMLRVAPIARVGPARVGAGHRAAALGLALALLGVLVTAWRLDPDPRGHGSHQQLGLPPCGFLVAFGRPCMTCGMTTSFALATDLRPVDAFRTQPMGALACLLTAAAFWGALHVAATGSRLASVAGRLLNGRTLWVLLGLTLAAWGYKLLTTGPSPGGIS